MTSKEAEAMFSGYYKSIYSWFYYRTGDIHLSEDLTSQTFLEAMRSLSSWKEKSSLKTWLFGIARHIWLHHLRKNRMAQTSELVEALIPSLKPGPEKQASLNQAKDVIDQTLKQMPERTRKIVLMRFDGYSFEEIAGACSISANSARVIDCRARGQLRAELKKEGFESCEDL